MDTVAGQRVVIFGLGRFGGGAGAAHWAAAQGADVLVTDLATEEALRSSLDGLNNRAKVSLRLGEHRADDFRQADLIVVNPAIPRPWSNEYLQAAAEGGARITTEIRLLTERLRREQVIGVTGSAGKSTTTAMIAHILRRIGATMHLGGNIGGSLLPRVAEISPDDHVVLELSSFMLYWLGSHDYPPVEPWSPGYAVLTNVQANHLDWHVSETHYRRCKENIFASQRSGDVAIRSAALAVPRVATPLPGLHNEINGATAVEAVHRAAGVDRLAAIEMLQDFAGLPHRLELVATDDDDRRFFNDSKSTTPAATVLAVESFDCADHVHVIVGGYDKGSDLSSVSGLASRIAGLYTIGATGLDIARNASAGSPATWCDTLDRAVDAAMERMRPGDVLVLSPGCASWDQFTNYEARGEAFRSAVRRQLEVRCSDTVADDILQA